MERPSLVDGAIRGGGDPLNHDHQEQQEQNAFLQDQQVFRHQELRPISARVQQDPRDHYQVRKSMSDSSQNNQSHDGSSGQGSNVTSRTSNISGKKFDADDDRRPVLNRHLSGISSATPRLSNRESDIADQPVFLRYIDDNCSAPDYEVNLFFQLCEVTLQPVTATSKEVTRWANIRRWFMDHRSRAERYAACVQQGVSSTSPLHFICQHPNCPLDIVKAIINYGTETVSWEDTNGWLPLHYACAKNASIEVLEALVDAYPEGDVAQDKRMRTPLHFVFYKTDGDGDGGDDDENDSSSQLGDADIYRVVDLLKAAIMIGDEKGRLPIHFAAAYGASEAALEALSSFCPRSLYAKENTGRSPLHYAMANAHNDTSPKVLRFLLKNLDNDSSVDEVDNEGNLPLHLMSLRVEGMGNDTIQDNESKENVKACLRIYLDSKPILTADCLTALQSLPQWLRDTAVTHSHVQKILNRRIAGTFPTFILLSDVYLYIMIIICFTNATSSHILFRFDDEVEELPSNVGSMIGACIFGATYFLVREMVKVASMISLNTIRSWFRRFETWMNLIVISLIYYYSGAMQRRETGGNGQEDEDFRTGVAFTLGTLWLSVVNFLKSTMLEFSVFYETVLYVTKKLFIFMISLAVILIAFAQMFLIVFRQTHVCSEDCKKNSVGFPHCSFNKSFLKVFTMMLGEIGEVNRYQQSSTAQIIYVAFVFVVVILLSNVLIAIVTDFHSIVKNERAEMVFWSNRLDFVAEMDTVDAMKKRLVARLFRGDYLPQEQDPDQPSRQTWAESLREYWDLLVSFLKETQDDASLLEYYVSLFLRLLIVILAIPFWLCLGLCTAGLLWPPQIREYIFVTRTGGHQEGTATEIYSNMQVIEDMINQTKKDFGSEVKRVNDDHDVLAEAVINVKNSLESSKNDIFEIKRITEEMLAAGQQKFLDQLEGEDRGGSHSSSSSKNRGRRKTKGRRRRSRSNTSRLTSTIGDNSD